LRFSEEEFFVLPEIYIYAKQKTLQISFITLYKYIVIESKDVAQERQKEDDGDVVVSSRN
jgi:hypothetical protein